ncbi:MAG: Smr/MutS family protein [Deltaproteobacteria bacterium]
MRGEAAFHVAETTEFIEGAVADLDRRTRLRLRRGELSVQAHLDLHGLTREEARVAVEQFVRSQRLRGHRCVLIVHGRGLNSKDGVPVLKEALARWLSRGPLGRSVLAFCTARPCDGGGGALYLLLRR